MDEGSIAFTLAVSLPRLDANAVEQAMTTLVRV